MMILEVRFFCGVDFELVEVIVKDEVECLVELDV